jgi:hypothetical protein
VVNSLGLFSMTFAYFLSISAFIVEGFGRLSTGGAQGDNDLLLLYYMMLNYVN